MPPLVTSIGLVGSDGDGTVRLIWAIAALVVALLIGLWIYGEMLKPKTQQIQQEAVRAEPAQP